MRYLVDDPLFRIDACQVKRGERFHLRSEGLQIIALLKGRLEISHGETKLLLNPGEFALLPASLWADQVLPLRHRSSFCPFRIAPGKHEKRGIAAGSRILRCV